jgi:signal transduction histidine kinase/ligand-binding sensor domain-containing protein/DNA-binding response OmpR family regulator
MIPYGFQDRIGYLWFGCYHGVFRFDGYSFKKFITLVNDSSKVTKAEVKAICDDANGNIWIGHIQGLDRLNPVTEDVTHYILNSKASITDLSNRVLSLCEDRKGNIWVGTANGLYLFDNSSETIEPINQISTYKNSLINNTINTIHEDRTGTLWFGTDKGLDKLDASTNKFIHYLNGNDSEVAYQVFSIYEDKDGLIWIGTSNGLVEFRKQTESCIHYKNDPKDYTSLPNNYIKSICEDTNGNLWLGSSGIIIFNKNAKKFFHHTHNEKDPASLSENRVSKILLDKSGTIWITTYGGGINKYTLPNQFVKKYTTQLGIITNTGWGNLVEDYNGKIWIGTDKGLISFDPIGETFKKESLSIEVNGILLDEEGTIWINSNPSGNLYYKKDKSEQIRLFLYSNGKAFNEDVACMYNSKDGCIWIGTVDGKILKLNQKKNTIEHVQKYDNQIYELFEDTAGLLWIGTFEGGVILYDPEKKTSERFISDPKDPMTLRGNQVYDFCEDAAGTIWIGAGTCLNKYDKLIRKCIPGGGKDGLPNEAFSLVADAHGNLWINTINGAVKYNPLTKEIAKYNDVKLGWGYSVRNGELYFVSTTFFSEKQSIIRINPDNISNNKFVPPVVVTSFRKFEKPYPAGNEINLPFDENYISFEFAALSYNHPEKNQYAYKMEGIDKDWIYPDKRRYASYPNLDPGEYVFRVKGSNSDGIWNEVGTSIVIFISPPWWKTWWAYSSYVIIFVVSLYGIRRSELHRLKLRNKVKIDEAVLKEREETDKMKSRFFANISHEFRTPLTLILGPAEKISSKTSDDIVKDSNIIKRNSRRLLQLINQLLDLSKLEAGKLKLEASKGNIVSFVKGAALSFESLAESKDITLKISSEKEYIEMYFDKEKMMKILTNILSNAFKFTPEEGTIIASVNSNPPLDSPFTKGGKEGGSVEIKIRDTGIGIAQDEIPKLFDRFYQVDSSHTREYEGTGIGLALTKELVELHHGSIRVESEKGSWTEFTLQFPLGKDHLSEGLVSEKDDEIIGEKTDVILNPDEIRMKNLTEEVANENYKKDSSSHFDPTDRQAGKLSVTNNASGTAEENSYKTIILVVEDNYDMRQYIRESLDGNYLIEEAVNGEQGVRKAEKIIPDLIISDMMMPKMDGNQLVKILKNDEKTSHIPIILLTAKAGQENKLEGLEIGADDYLTKPFDIKELQVRIKNLINIRKTLQEKFSKVDYVSKPNWKKLPSIDEQFINKVLKVIEDHISEESFNIECFGDEVGMSKTQFYRKLKAITGMPASIYLRTVRLSKAKKMIEERQGTISEIAYSVGFSSPSYFTKCFKDEFGYPPSETDNSG